MAFEKGKSGNPAGRPKGPNKATVDLKRISQRALLELSGGGTADDPDLGAVEYLKVQAVENPVAFLAFVGRGFPKDVNVDVTGGLQVALVRSFVKKP